MMCRVLCTSEVIFHEQGAYAGSHEFEILFLLRNTLGASLVAQWLRICLPMQGTRVRALAREDTTCRGVNEPVCRNY